MYISYKLYGLRNKSMYIREAGHIPLEKGVAGHGNVEVHQVAGHGKHGGPMNRQSLQSQAGFLASSHARVRMEADQILIAFFTIF